MVAALTSARSALAEALASMYMYMHVHVVDTLAPAAYGPNAWRDDAASPSADVAQLLGWSC